MIKVQDLHKSFGEPPIEILKGISFTIPDDKFVSITGRSGSGKSTLLYSMSTLDQPSQGKVFFDQIDTSLMNDKDIHQFRNEKMGFIFQFHYLLPELSALENVLMPTRRQGLQIKKEKRAKDLLAQFGLDNKFDNFPKQLSGGEQQRVAIARSLIMNPRFVFADEPTGNLDSINGDIVMKILKDFTRTEGTTVVYVTHDKDYAQLADIQIQLVDGKLV